MPDRWGRINSDDWNAATRLINSIGSIESRNKDRQYEKDVNANLGLLQEGSGNYGLSGPVGTKKSQVAARSLYAGDLKNQQLIKGSQDTKEYETSLNNLVTWRQENPDISWDNAPKGFYTGVNGQRAYVDAIRLGADTAEGKQRRQAAINQLAAQSYPVFVAQKELSQKALQSGKIDTAVNALRKMSEQLPMPYRLGDFNPETQSFDVQYLDSKTGKFQSTGTKSLDEVMKMTSAIGGKEYVDIIALNAMAVEEGNREKRQNPQFGKNANGDRFLVIPQKQWANPNQVEIEVRNEKTNEKTIFPSWEALQDFGIQIENLEQEKKKADIDRTKAYTMGSSGLGNQVRMLYHPDGRSVKTTSPLQVAEFENQGFTPVKYPTGMRIETGPDGTVIQTGAPSSGQTPKGAKTALFKDIVAGQTTMDEMNYLDKLYEPDFLTYGGLFKNLKSNVLNKIDPDKRDQFTQRREAFVSAVNQSFIKYRKWATGVAGGEKEMAEIKRSVPNANDSPQAYESKTQLRKSLTRRLIARQKAALKAGVNNQLEFKKYLQDHPLDSIPTLQQRGDQLMQMGYEEDQVLRILTDEGYIMKGGN